MTGNPLRPWALNMCRSARFADASVIARDQVDMGRVVAVITDLGLRSETRIGSLAICQVVDVGLVGKSG